MKFHLVTTFKPSGDQPEAIAKLVASLRAGVPRQTLLGVTGSGKTYTMASVIEKIQRPTLVISHNKTLAAQLYQEFKSFFPENAVHYFVSYYDYYQPEAYIPQTDTYIEKDAKINDEIDKLRHAATAALLTRRDVIVVASVSCIYGIGDPEEYGKIRLELSPGQTIPQKEVLHHLTNLQYHRNDFDPRGGEFRVRGEAVEVWLPSGEERIRLIWGGKKLETVETRPSFARQNLSGQAQPEDATWKSAPSVAIFPAKHFVTPSEKLELAIKNIEAELAARLKELRDAGKLLEAERLERRTTYDLEMLRETGYVTGIENYSRHLSFRGPGEPPSTLLDYFSKDWLLFIDESHMTIPQLNGMYNGDKARKEVLVEYGFRLPSALDNRPLKFEEFKTKMPETIFVSATPGPYEFETSTGHVVEQLIRPTGLLDPTVEVRPTKNQIEDLIREIQERVARKERTLVVTLTKRLAEDLAEFLAEKEIRVHYLHSEIKTLARPEILRDLRLGKVDVIVGINLLREGLDLPEVALVAILDADKEGFLRNETTLIQTMGRAARNVNGHVILYADTLTLSMKRATEEVARRRKIQEAYNKTHGITPKTITKEIRESLLPAPTAAIEFSPLLQSLTQKNLSLVAKTIEQEMKKAAAELEFEKAAYLRDKLREVRTKLELKAQSAKGKTTA